MKFGWTDQFPYGMFVTNTVRHVWRVKPSYLVWTLGYTNHTFADEIMEELDKFVAKGPRPRAGLTITLYNKYLERTTTGVPW